MTEKSKISINFNKILQLICKEIYDSPLSMLRENVQNSYDAILMRKRCDSSMQDGCIRVVIDNKKVIVSDNGIGMTTEQLQKNYWTAGTSGKNNDYARAAGVVGTFGIGAMANFGVCQQLKVVTRHYDSDMTITSWVNRDDLSKEDGCIHTSFDEEQLDKAGTKVIANLDNEHVISVNEAIEYLTPFVKYLPTPLYVNDKLISCQGYRLPYEFPNEVSFAGDDSLKDELIFHYRILLNKNSFINPRIELTNIKSPYYDGPLGDVVLNSTDRFIYGLRNGFGLSQIPFVSSFGMGGVANLMNLVPTAGRDALSRQSLDVVMRLISRADQLVAKAIASTEMADNSRELIQYIKNHGAYSLADNIKIGVANSEERITLGEIKPIINERNVMYYSGADKTVLSSYEDHNNMVLIPSNDRIRKYVQIHVLRDKGISEIADTPVVLGLIETKSLTSEELSILFKIKSVVEDDYLVLECKVDYAEISHGLSVLVQQEQGIVHIYLKRESSDLVTVARLYKDNYSLFEPFVKDFVRNRLYNKLAPYIPSSQREGAEVLYEMLQRKKELYTIEPTDYGSIDYFLNEYLQGRGKFEDVLKAVNRSKNKQKQILDSAHVGDAYEILGESPVASQVGVVEQDNYGFDPMPPILRLAAHTEYKILTTDSEVNIEGYASFLALSEKMDHDFRDFFFQPHTTRVIWSMHKIIYIFTHASGGLTLYYEMDLQKKLSNNATGGKAIKTATIITDNRIFIPIIDEFRSYFDVKIEKLTFLVRYDSVKS